MNAIDLFAGAGGMSVGAVQAGIDVKFAVECDKFAAGAYRINHPGCEVFADDIRKLPSRVIAQIPRGSNGTVVFGGPPCQGFSYSNTRTRGAYNEDNWLFEHFVRVVKLWRPDFVVLENVRGIIDTAQGLILHAIIDRFERLGYILTYGILNSVEFGVPQNRKRFFLVGSRTNRSAELPRPVESRYTTVRDAIGDLPSLENGASTTWLSYGDIPPSKYARNLRENLYGCSSHFVTRNSETVLRRYTFVPPGGNWEDIPPNLMRNYKDRNRCHTGIYHRLRYDHPSIVIGNYRKNMLIHPSEDRGLSVREAARIQSFPDTYEFAGSIGFQQQQVGNAVPPLLAKAVFEKIRCC
ncbi:MAG: DNA cytosine methyltransferase [Gemmatimonadota bacterium]|nr:DNA cytosine methyltransferase [Gemmatimonadota bacterium]